MKLTIRPLLLFLLLPAPSWGSDAVLNDKSQSPADSKALYSPTETAKAFIEGINNRDVPNPSSAEARDPQPLTSSEKDDVKDHLLPLAQLFAIIVCGGWALFIYDSNRRAKKIEVLMELEQEYRNCRPFLLQIELDYDAVIKPVLERRANGQKSMPGDSCIMQKLDGTLRHFLVCLSARDLGVIDKLTLDKMYRFYLRRLCNLNSKESDKTDRAALAAYVDSYWPSIMTWGRAVSLKGAKGSVF